ncbi:hypothetical protein BGW42_000309 [Actinomortierella wolfii]|nr:hypothetical protein BGW42_000309 [Actinomortierella wolfii]
MLTNRPPTSTIKASTSRHVANSRPTDDQNQDAGQDHHRRHRTHRQGVERAVDPSKLGTRSTASKLESKRLQEQDSDSNNHTSDLRERDRNNQKEQQQQQQQQQQVRERDDHLHPHSSRQSRSTSRQRSGESSKHSRHHHHHHHHHHQRSSRPAVDEDDESALRTSIGRGRGRGHEHERNNSPFDRPQSRHSTMDEDLANVSIRTNPGKRDGSGLLTIRDILDDPELQTVKGLTRGGEQLPQKQSSQIHQSQSRKALRQPLPEDGTEQGAGNLKPNGRAAGGTSRRSQESLATQQHSRTSDKPNRVAATMEDNRYDPSLTSNDTPLDRSPKLQQFRDRLDNFMSRVKQKATTGNDMKGYQDPVVRSQTTHSATKGVPSTPSAIKRAPKDIPDFSMDDSVFITSMDDEQDDSEDEEDEDDTDVTQKTAEHIPSLARSNQAVASSSKARQPPNNSAGTATNAPSTRARQPQDKMVLSRHAPQRPDIENHDQDDEDLSDDPGYENFDSFARETALARARREQAKGQQLRKSSSKTGRSPSLETKGASGSVEQWSHTSPSLLGLPAPATTSRANSKSPATVSSSKSPLVSPRFVGVDGGVVSNHHSSFNRSLRKEQQQQQQQQPLAVGVPSSLNKLSISPVHVPVNTTPTTTTHTRRRTLDHGRDLALEDLTSPTGQDPVMGGILGGRRGSKKPTLLTADDDDDRFPRPSIMSPYMRLNEPVQLHDHAATEGRFFDLAGSIGEGQAVSHVYDMLKDQIRRLKREKKALLSVIKSLKKDIRKAQRELARERREKDALSASLSAYSSASPSSRAQHRKNNGTKVEQVLESLQQRVEAIEGLVATKEKLIEEQNKELSILHADLSEDEEDSDLESEESESDDDDEEDEEEEEEEPLRLSRAISVATPQAGKSHRKDTKRSSLKGKDKHRSSPALIDRAATGSSVPLDAATSPSPAVPATASSSSLRRSKDSKQEQAKVGENVVRFEVPLPSNMRASQVVYLPSLSHSLSALASLSMSPSSAPPGTGGDPKGLFIPATILSTQATTAAAAAAALTALSSSPSPSMHHQKDLKDENDHHQEQETDEDDDDGEDEQRGADQRPHQSALSRSGSSKDQGAGAITVSTRPKPVMDPTVIKTIDSLRRSIGRYESPTAASRRQGETMEPEDNSKAQQEDSDERQSEQMPDQQTKGDTLRRSKAVYGDEISMKSSTGPTAGKDAGEDESESRQGRSERSVSGRFDLDEQSMIDSDIEARPPKIHIDMDRVLSLLKAHNPKRCVVCNSQHAGGSRDRNSHTHHKDSRRHEVNKGDHQCQDERPQKPSSQSQESRAETSDQQPMQPKNIPTVDNDRDEQGQQAPPNSHEEEDQQVQQPDDDKNANDIDAELNEIMDGFYHRLGFAEHNYRGSYRELQELHTLLEQYKRSCGVDPQKLATAEQKIQRIEHMLMQAAQLFKTTEQKFHE